ncbi:MAG TPA: hypothetical protein VEB60_01840 [Candidatus Paceibacterota bacterium]|nr:hypothetical protein [Candidatus Paceibacterota bacterium]
MHILKLKEAANSRKKTKPQEDKRFVDQLSREILRSGIGDDTIREMDTETLMIVIFVINRHSHRENSRAEALKLRLQHEALKRSRRNNSAIKTCQGTARYRGTTVIEYGMWTSHIPHSLLTRSARPADHR